MTKLQPWHAQLLLDLHRTRGLKGRDWMDALMAIRTMNPGWLSLSPEPDGRMWVVVHPAGLAAARRVMRKSNKAIVVRASKEGTCT